MEFKQYRRKGLSEMRPYVKGEELIGVSISQPDLDNGSPKVGDMIARNPKNHYDQWLVAKKYFEDNLELSKEMNREDLENLAHLMYDEYCAMVGGKAFNGDNLPTSTEFFADVTKEKQANAWRQAACVALEFCNR